MELFTLLNGSYKTIIPVSIIAQMLLVDLVANMKKSYLNVMLPKITGTKPIMKGT